MSRAPARRTKSATASSSARAVGGMPRRSRTSTGLAKALLKALRSILRRWPKAAAVTRSSGRKSARRPSGRPQLHHRGHDLGGRNEGGGRHVEQALHRADMLGQDGQASVRLGARLGRQAVDDLLLEHQDHVGDLVGLVQPADQQRRRDVVGEVGDDPPGRRGRAMSDRSSRASASTRSRRPSATACKLLQDRDGAGIDFDRHDAGGAFEQQGARQPAGTGTDLDHQALIERRGSPRDAPRQVEIEQEMLAEPLARIETVRRDDLAQGRQSGKAVHGRDQVRRRRAMSSAMRSPAIRLVGSARPVPTISSAVPWSGEVRTKGRPSVTLTPPAKSTVLIGIRAWS